MATKDRCLPLKAEPKHSSGAKVNGQYANLNLNKGHKCSDADPIPSKTTISKINGNSTNDCHSNHSNKDKPNLKLGKSVSKIDSISSNSGDQIHKRWKHVFGRSSSTKNSSSTLSLHIAAYENANESGTGSFEKFLGSKLSKSKTFKKIRHSVKQHFGNSPLIDSFEIPRQQKDDSNIKPEIMQFTASQKLLKFSDDGTKENELNNDESGVSTDEAKMDKKGTTQMTIDEDRPRPAKGLSNLGNTCFYNSTMQCLMHTHALYSWQEMVTEEKELIISKNTVVNYEKKIEVAAAVITVKESQALPLVNALQNFLVEFRCGKGPNPSPLFSQIAVKAPRFRGWAQQDAHELLRYLLDGIRSEELKRYKEAIFAHLGVEDKPTPEQTLMCKAMLESTDHCYIDSIFGGSLLQIISCSKCKHMSNSLEPFLDLSLPLNYGAPSTPTVQMHFPLPNNRREGTPSKHQTKKMKKKERKEAKLAAKKNKNAPTENGNDESQPVSSPQSAPSANETSPTTASANPTDDIKAIDENSDTDDDASSTEDMSVSENENNENGNNDPDEAMECSSPNYVSVLSPQPPEEDTAEVRTVLNSLKHFTASENLCASNAYECESCCAPHNKSLPANSKEKMTVEATKRYLIYSPPCVLTVHLKRFEQVPMNSFGNRMRTRKIRGHIEFPFELDIAPFIYSGGQRVQPGQREVIYSLYGIVSHSGDLGGGHYVAYIKSRNKVEHLKQFMEAGLKPDKLCEKMEKLNNGTTFEQHQEQQQSKTPSLSKDEILQKLDENATWYYASDSHVRTITKNEVKNAEAYILFYERII